jgi:hypothetical protein
MQNPTRYLRLFDIKKYREIQPIIEGIVKRSAEDEQVVSLLEAVIDIAKGNDFRQYNDPEDPDTYVRYFQRVLGVIKTSGIVTLFDMLNQEDDAGFDVVQELYSFICCPKYQVSTYDQPVISGTSIEYGDTYYGFRVCDLDLHEMLSFYYPSERLPIEMKGEGFVVSVFDQQQLATLTRVAVKDTSNLRQLSCDSDEDEKRKLEYLEFYTSFNYLLRLANLCPEYSILNKKWH